MSIVTHSFLLEDAQAHGTSAAAILYHLKYLQQTKVDKTHATHAGRHWVNYTYESLAVTFPYLSLQQIRRIMKKLTDSGVVVKEHLSPQRFNRELYWHVTCVGIDSSDVSESTVVHVSESTVVLHPSNIKLNIISDALFDDFWKVYPKRTDKKKARAAFLRLSEESQRLAVADVKPRSKDESWTKAKGQYVPNPTTYINGEKWNDEWKDTNRNGDSKEWISGVHY